MSIQILLDFPDYFRGKSDQFIRLDLSADLICPGNRLGEIDLLRAIPSAGLRVPLYLLGSSDFSARLAAALGLPFAFASHFAPDSLRVALQPYRTGFQPSADHQKPHAIVGVNVFAADDDAAAWKLFSSLQQQFLNLIRGHPRELPPPVDRIDALMSPVEARHVRRMTRYSAVGSAETVRLRLEEIIDETQADEIIATAQIHDPAARLKSFEILAQVRAQMS